jgi:hypothetical protein
MEWTCRKCGKSVVAGAVDLLSHTNWWITSPGGGLCPHCVQDAAKLGGEDVIRITRSTKFTQARVSAAARDSASARMRKLP